MIKIFSILFLSLLFLKLGGYSLFLSIQQEIIREEMEEKIIENLPNNQLIELQFTAENQSKIEWERAEKEFRFHGKMYDIVRTEIIGTQTIFYCIADEKESEIVAQLSEIELSSLDNLPLKKTTFSLLNLLFQKYILPQKFVFSSTFLNAISSKITTFSFNNYFSKSPAILIPPPKF